MKSYSNFKTDKEYYEYFYQHYLVECGYFIYNGVESENGGCGYLYNCGFDNIFPDGDEITVFDVLKTDENIQLLKNLMSDSNNKIIKISDQSEIVKIEVTSKDNFLKHVESYSEEVICNEYDKETNMFLYKWNII